MAMIKSPFVPRLAASPWRLPPESMVEAVRGYGMAGLGMAWIFTQALAQRVDISTLGGLVEDFQMFFFFLLLSLIKFQKKQQVSYTD
jgi:hypothetical protein